MARLYSNENVPLPVVIELRRLGHDVLTTSDAGQSNAAVPDPQVLATATADDRALLTYNRRHFIRLHIANSKHSGIIACTVDSDFVGQAHRIDETIRNELPLTGKLIRVARPQE